MFGTKFRSWMEAHIVRPRKKQQRNKDGNPGKGANTLGSGGKHGGKMLQERGTLESSWTSPSRINNVNKSQVPVATENQNRLERPLQHNVPSSGSAMLPSVRGDGYHCSMVDRPLESITLHPHYPNTAATAGTTSANGVTTGTSLSSPESAYSTGYSTDGTSPGASFPPEYYINIRTGTHYFQQGAHTGPLAKHRENVNCALAPAEYQLQRAAKEGKQVEFLLENELSNNRTHMPKISNPHATSIQTHRRTESFDENRRYPASIRTSFILVEETAQITLPQPVVNHVQLHVPNINIINNNNVPQLTASPSPRQRSRIRTNPWLSNSNVGTTSSGSSCSVVKFPAAADNSCNVSTCSSGVKSSGVDNTSSGSASDGTLPTQQTAVFISDRLVVEKVTRSPRKTWCSPRSERSSNSASSRARKASLSSSSTSSPSRPSQKQIRSVQGSDEDDVTLNEMLGKFDESYVYEKETDILSDSDPTDCEDYNDTDIDTGQDGGDECDPLDDDDDDFDFIDNGSYQELNQSESDLSSRKINTGHCTYYNFHTDLARKQSRHRESFLKRSARRQDSKEGSIPSSRRTSARSSIRGRSRKQQDGNPSSNQGSSKQASDKRRRRSGNRRSTNERNNDGLELNDNGNEGFVNGNNSDMHRSHGASTLEGPGMNLNRLLMEKMILRSSSNGTRSVGGTPLSLRRRRLENISENEKKNSSTSKLIIAETTNDYEETTKILECTVKKRSNSVSFGVSAADYRKSIPGSNYLTTFDSEVALIEADQEADQKYRELILEAEHILVSMKSNTPVLGSPRRAIPSVPTNKRVEHLRHTESLTSDMLFSKNRNMDDKICQSISIPNSPKFSGSPRFSPKKNHITNFINSNSPELSRRESMSSVSESPLLSPRKIMVHSPRLQRQVLQSSIPASPQRAPVCPKSPLMRRRNLPAQTSVCSSTNRTPISSIPGSPQLQLNGRNISPPLSPFKHRKPKSQSPILHIDDDSDSENNEKCFKNLSHRVDNMEDHKVEKSPVTGRSSPSRKYQGIVGSSSSDSDAVECDATKVNKAETQTQRSGRAPLLTFRSVDMGHRVEDSTYCPQSEPVKRKVYTCSATFDRLQKSLEKTQPHHIIRQKSDGEASEMADDPDGACRTTLREKVAQLRRERLAVEARTGSSDEQASVLQQQISLFRRQMLLHTIEGLKRSLEDQSASLQQTYHGSSEAISQTDPSCN